ncbi:DUF1990 family protein [Propionibacteriaceae bacterium Y1923]
MEPDSFADLPERHRRFCREVRVAGVDFEAAVDDLFGLFGWRVHGRAGLRVQASDRPLQLGTTVRLRLGRGVFAVVAPCRVVEVLDEPDRRGFTYRALPGHPEAGVERFVVVRDGSGVWFRIEAASAPATWWARLGGPLTRLVQNRVTRRYLRAWG